MDTIRPLMLSTRDMPDDLCLVVGVMKRDFARRLLRVDNPDQIGPLAPHGAMLSLAEQMTTSVSDILEGEEAADDVADFLR
jgi:hypothetical protein